MSRRPGTVTELLQMWGAADRAATEKLLSLVYVELKRLAAHRLRGERVDHTLEPTALVHEAFLRLRRSPEIHWQSRGHFYGVAARAMREVLIDHARSHLRKKRGGGAMRVDLDHAGLLVSERPAALLALDCALNELARLDPTKASVVELHFFGGFTVAETARLLGCSTATVSRQWRMAKAWLAREVEGSP